MHPTLLILSLLLVHTVHLRTIPSKGTPFTELSEHFAVKEAEVFNLGQLLLQIKKLAHRSAYGNREFGFESNGATNPPDTPFLFEGDIFLTNRQATTILSHLEENNRPSRSLSSDPEALWRHQPIKYRFHESLDFFAISQIVEAIDYWKSNTCIQFEHSQQLAAPPEGDYLEFFKGKGCYSMIGRYGGRQGVSIGAGCERVGIVEHEVGHALGLWHEQSRPDAAKFIEVEKDYILPSYMSDFQLRGADEIITLGVAYDYGSVMHYGPTSFSADGTSLTLVTKNTLFQSTIGQRERLSFLDLQIINKAYCADKCRKRPSLCANGGYPHPTQCAKKCICPSGFGGLNCDTFQQPKNADCGGLINVTNDTWVELKSPNYDQGGYLEDQRCSWILSSRIDKDKRIELEFIGEFAFLCSTTCVDYVELKLERDQRGTGARFCCDKRPNGTLISERPKMAIIFRSQVGRDIGFKLRARATNKAATKSQRISKVISSDSLPHPSSSSSRTTTAEAFPRPGPLPMHNEWLQWSGWSECSKSCGGCGIQSRKRECPTEDCEGKSEEFSACNFSPCIGQECCPPFFLSTTEINQCSTDSGGKGGDRMKIIHG